MAAANDQDIDAMTTVGTGASGPITWKAEDKDLMATKVTKEPWLSLGFLRARATCGHLIITATSHRP